MTEKTNYYFRATLNDKYIRENVNVMSVEPFGEYKKFYINFDEVKRLFKKWGEELPVEIIAAKCSKNDEATFIVCNDVVFNSDITEIDNLLSGYDYYYIVDRLYLTEKSTRRSVRVV